MGFHVRIDETSEQLLTLLNVAPSQVFGKLYSAYLLFLATEHDRAQLDWIVSHAPGLDSLTGAHLAYAVFAKRFKVRLKSEEVDPDRPSRNIGEMEARIAAEPGAVSRLVENGRFGVVLDGDELTAITYGTDIVARELNLLDKLPCLVVLDAIPAKIPRVIKLEPQLLPALFQLLRGAVSRFNAVGGHKIIRRDTEEVLRIQGLIEAEHVRDARLRSRIATEREKLIALRSKIDSGVTTKDPNFFRDIVIGREKVIVDLEGELNTFSEEHPRQLAALDSELKEAMHCYELNSEKRFSHCLEAELLSNGFKVAAASAKVNSISFMSSIFNPEVLLKLWALVP